MPKAIPGTILSTAAIICLALVARSCGSDENKSPEQATRAQTEAPTERGNVPQTILNMENDAEDAIDQVLGGRWDRVSSDAGSLGDTWKDFLSSSDASG